MNYCTYLDESGDLGFKFDAPFKNGGSSRYFCMAFFLFPEQKKDVLHHLVEEIYTQFHFPPHHEIKGSQLSDNQKIIIAKKIISILEKHQDISVHSISIQKEKLIKNLAEEPHLMYNYMLRMSLLDNIKNFTSVKLIRDKVSTKLKSTHSLIEYLKTTLYFEYSSSTKLIDEPVDSKSNKGIILADWLSNIVFSHYEENESDAFNILYKELKNKTL